MRDAIDGLYSVHPNVATVRKWVADLPARTGRSLDEWMAFLSKNGPSSEKELRDWLKAEFGLGTNIASWLAERARKDDNGIREDDPESYLQAAVRYVEAMYSGPKAGLRPIYDQLLAVGLGIGPDVKACPCQTIVPLYRSHVFAQLKPTTRTRLDLGLALGDTPAGGRLIDTGGYAKKDRITHRIGISSVNEIDSVVVDWLRAAYNRDV